MDYFNESGRRIPTAKSRIFAMGSSSYYRLNQPALDHAAILRRSQEYGLASESVSVGHFTTAAQSLAETIRADRNYANLFRGVHVPFVVCSRTPLNDIGKNLEEVLLPSVGKAFGAAYPEAHYKAILQGNSKLTSSVSLDLRSRYRDFVKAAESNGVVGWYFPQAMQEYDIESQRQQMEELPPLTDVGICLSGGMDICASLVGTPGLLINQEAYSPILCMSSYVHSDDRMVLLMKSYGPHLEFWCMTQMLTPSTKQVSEQWAGGITLFRPLGN